MTLWREDFIDTSYSKSLSIMDFNKFWDVINSYAKNKLFLCITFGSNCTYTNDSPFFFGNEFSEFSLEYIV